MSSKPELVLPPEQVFNTLKPQYYNEKEAEKYSNNTHIIDVQTKLTERALEILAFPPDKKALILDIGCGSGISGCVLSDYGHEWVGMDVSKWMLNIAVEREVEGDLLYADMGEGFGFRPGTFDGAISISALQWLCTAETKKDNPIKRIHRFFESLYRVLVRGGRCVISISKEQALQLYPHNAEQIELLTNSALKCGLIGGLVVDYPHSTKAKKYFLMFNAGFSEEVSKELVLPKGIEDEEEKIDVVDKKANKHRKGKVDRSAFKSRDWIMKKKERARLQGKKIKTDSKYTGRKRPDAF